MADYNDYNSSLTAQKIESTLLGAVVSNRKMSLSEKEKAQARENIGAGSSDSGMTILGFFDTYDELLAAITEPSAGNAYGVGLAYPYDIYIWDVIGNRWVNAGPIRGADGTDANVTKENIEAALGYVPNPPVLSFQITLLGGSFWADGQQTITDARFLAEGYAYIVSPASASFAAYAESVIFAEDVSADGSIVFRAENAPATDIIVNVARMVSV